MPQKHINKPSLKIDNTDIKRIAEFYLLYLTINQHIKWNSHINTIALKIISKLSPAT